MRLLLSRVGNPHRGFSSLHVAGTNGKGSTCAFAFSILREQGYKVGLYTSPHLACARERIAMNGCMISEADFARLQAILPQGGTFFERLTVMAFLYFAEQKVDMAVIEVGLGGRLDATNVLTPLAVGISRIGLDHQEWLGDNLLEIAAEKAGILKPGVPACWSPQEPEVDAVFCRMGGSNAYQSIEPSWELGLKGSFQSQNASLAVSLIRSAGIDVSSRAIQDGLRKTRWPCRYEWISENPKVLIDGAHNPDGTQTLIDSLREDLGDSLSEAVLWIGCTQGHSVEDIAALWYEVSPKLSVRVGQSRVPRAVPAAELRALFQQVGFQDVCEATETFESDRIHIITGSLYWSGEVRNRFVPMIQDPFLGFY
ncbi:MAG: bifunctional folylpolyglutamate synthase/dihydrofolate synthase [Myxococcaceae bacterium]|nr:bifunctional folylpolyglutamate synthase/dihydrofolate synthase [Myxococcaceae bacterium]